MTPTICLNMIVRDEARIVHEALDSVRPYLSTWVIVDTGSTDGTAELIERYFEEAGIPGELHRRPWRDFGHNRSEALALARDKADYLWVIDADDRLVGTPDLSCLQHDAYLLRYGPDFRYWRKQIFRAGLPWRYVGVLHEYPECLTPDRSESRLLGEYHVESRRLGARSAAPDKYRCDAELLERALADEPGNERYWFYLGQSWFDAGEYARSEAAYRQRATMGGYAEEVYYSLLRVAQCGVRLGNAWTEIYRAFIAAWNARPTRAEPLVELAALARGRGEHDLAYSLAHRASTIPMPEQDQLFVDTEAYRWRALDELAVAAFYTDRAGECFEYAQKLLEQERLPEPERARILCNRDFGIPARLALLEPYPSATIERLTLRGRDPKSEITLTITTCRRLALFERTIDSFLHCCSDVERIGRLICIDDGSSEADRGRMRARYPFFEFVFKERADKGHARSMNRLLDLIDTPYCLHLEDDWQFFVSAPYVARALAILDDDPTLGQVLFNPNYAEKGDQREIVGGEPRRTRLAALRYRVHQHVPRGTPAWEAHFAALGPGERTAAWWPHYSLRPSMIRMAAIRATGRYDPDAAEFEYEFAMRYVARGFQSAFFDFNHQQHSGRLTSDSGPQAPANAYALNDEPQFGRPAAAGTPPPAPSDREPVAATRVQGELTVVTGLIDLSAMEWRPWWRDLAGYLRDAAWILSVPCPLIVYMDPSCLELFRPLRPDGLPTEWIPFPPEQCRWWSQRQAIAEMLAFHRPDGTWDDKDTPSYHAVIYQKTEWLADAAARNPFGTPGFAWIDFGVHGYVQRPPHLDRGALAAGLAALSRGPWDERVRVCAMMPAPADAIAEREQFFSQMRSAISGGLVAGSAEAVAWFAHAVREEIDRCLASGIAVTDEMIWGWILHREPELFRPHYGSWVAAVANTGAARAQIDEIIYHAKLANDRGVTDQALARLEFITPSIGTFSPGRWARAMTEHLRASLIADDNLTARQTLLAMIHGALCDTERSDQLARRAMPLLAIADSVVEPASEATFERLDPWTESATRIDCLVDEAFSPWMLSPLAIRYVPRARVESSRYARISRDAQ